MAAQTRPGRDFNCGTSRSWRPNRQFDTISGETAAYLGRAVRLGRKIHASRECRRAARPPADQFVSLSDLLAGWRRHVFRRLRPLRRNRGAARAAAIQVLDVAAQWLVRVAHVPRHDHRRAGDRVSRRSLRPPLYLSVQPDDLRPCVVGGGIRARHVDAERIASGHGSRTGRRNRGGLLDPDRVRAAGVARPLARLHGVSGRLGPAGDDAARQSDHSRLRLAANVRDRRGRRADRLVSAQSAARIAALARDQRTRRGGRSGIGSQSRKRPQPRDRCRRRPRRRQRRNSIWVRSSRATSSGACSSGAGC